MGSYTTTGYFLLYLNEKYPGFLYDISQAAPTWTDDLWERATGKYVDTLWAEYQATFN